jgi:hypothetical protein
MKKILAFGMLLSIAFLPSVTRAQVSAGEEAAKTSMMIPAGNVSCMDYYHFNSIKTNIEATGTQAVPGSDVAFSGTLENTNDYPVVNGTLYLKVFLRNDETFKAGDGHQLVDQFPLEEKFTIDAKGEKRVEFSWHVPENARGGNYYLATFFATEGRYNLSGLSFSDDVVGTHVDFVVTSNQNNAILLDKTKTTLNGQNHRFVSFPLHFNRDETVDVKVTLANPSQESKVIQLTWEEYTWDALRKETLQNQKYELIEIGANASKEISYSVTPKNTAVSYLVVTAKDQYSKSIQDIRFVRDGIQETRINFPSITKFPLKAGEQNSIFACAHSTNLPNVPGNILTLTLRDEDQKTIHEYRYQGDITGAMGGWKDDFTPKKTYTKVFLTATLERNGEVVEEVTIPYNCEDINPDRCSEGALFSGDNTKSIVIIIGLFLTLIAVLAILISRQRNAKRTNRFKVLFLALILGGSVLVPSGVEGKTVNSGAINSPNLIVSDQYLDNICVGRCDDFDIDRYILSNTSPKYGPYGALQSPQATIHHGSTVFNNTTGMTVNDDFGRANVNVGDSISFRPRANQDTDIDWSGNGYSADTPLGEWSNGGPSGCNPAHLVETENYGGVNFRTYTTLHVSPSTPTISHSGTASLSCVNGGFDCTVMSAGTIDSRITYPATQGRYYTSVDKQGTLPDPADDWVRNGCNYSGRPMHDGGAQSADGCTFHFPSLNGPSDACLMDSKYEYQLPVPAMSLDHELLAIATNGSPAAPSLTGPTTGYTGTSYTFTVQGTDPDGDTIRYYMDWDNNGTGDGSPQPMFGYVASGTARTFSNVWATPGVYAIHAQTQDSKGAISGWSAPLIITITTPVTGVCGPANGFLTMNPPSVGLCNSGTPTAVTPGAQPGPYSWSCLGSGGGDAACSAPYLPPAPVVDLLVNGSNGPLAVNTGTNLNITWGNVANATSCTGSGYLWAGGKATTGGNDNIAMGTTSTLYTLTCSGPGGVATDTVSVAVNAPFVDLKINGSDTGITVLRNSNLNITWTPITNGVSATGSGNGWGGAKSLAGGTDNILATVSSDIYTLSSTNGDGTTRTDSIGVNLANTLKICENSCSSGIEPPASFTMVQGTTKTLRACINDAVSCTDSSGDITGSVTWSDGGTAPVTIATGLVTAVTSGTEGIRAFDPATSQTVDRVITVTCTDPGACSRDARTVNLCQSDTFTVVDSCGVTQDCNGTKSCDFNVKEVAP